MDPHTGSSARAPHRATVHRRTGNGPAGVGDAGPDDPAARASPDLRPGRILPELELRDATGRGTVRLRGGRGPRAIVALHGLDCDRCRAYAERLANHTEDAAAEQGGRFLVVLPGHVRDQGFAASLGERGIVVLEDPERRFASRDAFVVTADEWGEIYSFREAPDAHELPDPSEVVEWLQFIAIQCPECEGPEGEWRNI